MTDREWEVEIGELLENYEFQCVGARILESLTECRTMLFFAVFCKIGELERIILAWAHCSQP